VQWDDELLLPGRERANGLQEAARCQLQQQQSMLQRVLGRRVHVVASENPW
jgi:hypothetical protein